jgi:hypothetical protein
VRNENEEAKGTEMAIRCAKGDQGLGKWESAATMVRLVKELVQKLEDGEELTSGDQDQVNDILYPFIASLPKKVQEDLRQG